MTYTLVLLPDEWQRFIRPVNGEGGAQRLLHKLQACAVGEYCLVVEKDLLEKTYQYAYRYTANGGFQGRFRAVLKAALRAGWQPAPRVMLKATESRRLEDAA